MSASEGDCDDQDPGRAPDLTETPYDGIDQDCDGHDLVDADQDGVAATEAGGGDCDDLDDSTYPGADEPTDGIDHDCDGSLTPATLLDLDADGVPVEDGDCDDGDATVYPGAEELPYDGIDQDCEDGDLVDVDGDGFAGGGAEDCDDARADISPTQPEQCNGNDDDCDGLVDESGADNLFADEDRDGYGDASRPVEGCAVGEGSVIVVGDCNDLNSSIHPGVPEQCDGIDQDCDGFVDEDAGPIAYYDGDRDGYGSDESLTRSCFPMADYVTSSGDCNDTDATVNPGATEICNEADDNCSGVIDEGVTRQFYPDQDADGFGDASSPLEACAMPPSSATQAGDCNDQDAAISPAATEICDGVDQNCNGSIDEGLERRLFYRDEDGDGYGSPASPVSACVAPEGYISQGADCNDLNSSIHPLATESCNGMDDDCDGIIDEGATLAVYPDEDLDGYGSASAHPTPACVVSEGQSSNALDCDDSDPEIHPAGLEEANGKDDDCDGLADDGVYFPSCQALMDAWPESTSGVYTIDPGGDRRPITAYCRMEPETGDGWTLCASFGHQKRLNGLDYFGTEWAHVKGENAYLDQDESLGEASERVVSWGNFCPRVQFGEVYAEVWESPYSIWFRTSVMYANGNPFLSTGYRVLSAPAGGYLGFYGRGTMQPNGQFFSNATCGTSSNGFAQGSDLCVADGTRYQTMMGNANGNASAYDTMCAKSAAGSLDTDNSILIFVR